MSIQPQKAYKLEISEPGKMSHLFLRYLGQHYPNWNDDNKQQNYDNLLKRNYYEYYTFNDSEFYKNNKVEDVGDNYDDYDSFENQHDLLLYSYEINEELIHALDYCGYITNPKTEFYTEYIKNNMPDQYARLKKGDIIGFPYNNDNNEGIMIWDGEKACRLANNSYICEDGYVPNIYMLAPDNHFSPTYWNDAIYQNHYFFVCKEYLQEICESLEFSELIIGDIISGPEWNGYFTHLNVRYTVMITTEKEISVKEITQEAVQFELLNVNKFFRPFEYGSSSYTPFKNVEICKQNNIVFTHIDIKGTSVYDIKGTPVYEDDEDNEEEDNEDEDNEDEDNEDEEDEDNEDNDDEDDDEDNEYDKYVFRRNEDESIKNDRRINMYRNGYPYQTSESSYVLK